jgi:hypothetical protein
MAMAANMPARNVKGNVQAQDKMLYVANKLGLSSLKYMQGTTRVVYDQGVDEVSTHTFFEGAQSRPFPLSNLGASGNQFQVNEALLVEKIGFFIPTDETGVTFGTGTNISVKFDLIIGNKTVIKDFCVEDGGQQAFMGQAGQNNVLSKVVDLEGVGILIPPQVEYKLVAKIMGNTNPAFGTFNSRLGCYLYGTGALLNFNTSI